MRKSEILNLQWFDVQAERRLLHVRKTKNDRPRLVPINDTLVALLASLPKTSGYVMPSPRTGGRIYDFKRPFALARQKAKLNDFRFPDTRHPAASRIAEAGADAFALKEILGHSDIRMTPRYTHTTDDAKRRAVDSLSAAASDQLVTETKQPATRPAVSR